MTLTDLDSGDLHPLDHHVWNSSDDSVCDGSSDDLSSSEFCDLLKDMSSDDFMDDLSSSEFCDLLKDMSSDDWNQ